MLAKFLLRRASSVRVVSQKIADYLVHWRLGAHIFVLPVFVDLARFRGVGHIAHPRFAKNILWVGRFEPEKDPLKAVQILREVRASGVDAGLTLLGAGTLEERLRTATQDLAPYIEMPGWEDPLPYLKTADVVLSTSKHESYGASMIEALAAGVPVVAPDVGIAREAGAVIAERSRLADAVAEVLRSGQRGQLQLKLLSEAEWAKEWRETLI